MEDIRKQYSIDNNLIWDVAGLFIHDNVLFKIFNKMMLDKIKIPIDYIYGAPGDCILNGGRVLNPVECQLSYEEILDIYLNMGVACRLTFTNHLITSEHFNDKLANRMLKFLNDNQLSNIKNGVTVTLDGLKDYIRDKYPNLEVISSVIRPSIEVGYGNDSPNYYNNLQEDYDRIILNPGFAKDINNINLLQNKEKFELLANAICVSNCPWAGRDYTVMANEVLDKQLRIEHNTFGYDGLSCYKYELKEPIEWAKFNTDEIEKISFLGINKFKLEGRSWKTKVFLNDLNNYIINDSNYIYDIIKI